MGSGGVELAARLVSLEEGDSSSDARCQVVDEGDDELVFVLATTRPGTSCSDGSALGSFDSALAITQQFLVS